MWYCDDCKELWRQSGSAVWTNVEVPQQAGAVGTPERIAEIRKRTQGLRCHPYSCSITPARCMACQAAIDAEWLLDQVAALSASLVEKERERDAAQQQCADAERFGNEQEQRAIKAESDLAASRAEGERLRQEKADAESALAARLRHEDRQASALLAADASLAALRANAQVVKVARDRIDLNENDVPRQQCIMRLSMGELGHLNALLSAALASTPQASEKDALVSDPADQAKG
jgi:hypothetical protein